jgi:YD repeat-containing protein
LPFAIAALALSALASEASAEQRTFYDASGKVVGRSATDSQGTTTNYDSRGARHHARDDERESDNDP